VARHEGAVLNDETQPILIDNARAAMRQAERYLLLGMFGAVFVFLLPNSIWKGDSADVVVALPSGLPSASGDLVALFGLAVYFIGGFLALNSCATLDRVCELLSKNKAVHNTVMLYPSMVAARIDMVRLFMMIMPPALVLYCFFLEWPFVGPRWFAYSAPVVIAIPYVGLLVRTYKWSSDF